MITIHFTNQIALRLIQIRLIHYFFIFLTAFNIFLLSNVNQLHADTLTLKNGTVHENIRASIQKDKVIVRFQNNKVEEFSKSLVRSIKLKPILILTPKTTEEKAQNEKEKLRVAESLLDSEFLIEEDKKLNLAVLNLKMGSGIEKGELDLISEMITSGLVKTKIFRVMGKGIVNKALNEKGGEGCAEEENKCKESQTTILQSINVSKVLTGNVIKVKNKYFINGTILDVKTNKIDFAEVSSADSVENFQETTEIFSKKIAGGMLVYSSESFELKTEPSERSNFRKSFSNFFGKPVVQSALVPGLGQWNKNDKIKSIILFSSSILAIGVMASKQNQYNHLRSDYHGTQSLIYFNYITTIPYFGLYVDNRRNSISSEMNHVNSEIQIASGVFAIIYIYNLFDAYFAKEKAPQAPTLKSGFQFHGNLNSFSLANTNSKKESFFEASYTLNF